jgi:hypothetical protein
MNRLSQDAVLVGLARRLYEQGSWTGETHIQKAAYLLHELLAVPFDFAFILYKHGPFSFDLRVTARRSEQRPMALGSRSERQHAEVNAPPSGTSTATLAPSTLLTKSVPPPMACSSRPDSLASSSSMGNSPCLQPRPGGGGRTRATRPPAVRHGGRTG